MGKTFYQYCQETGNTALLAQWDAERNGDLTPNLVASHSGKRVWWRCEHGHSWQTKVYDRAHGKSCPVCMNRIAVPGFNDLGTTHPELAAQWHPAKNGDLTPSNVLAGSNKKVWWQCEHGHSWQAKVNDRTHGRDCPVCKSVSLLPGVNDLATTHPELAAQWHPTKNGTLTPSDVFAGSHRPVWWQCEHGHSWQAIVDSRAGGTGCPVCKHKLLVPGENDLATTHPDLAAQWHPTKNESYTPQDFVSGTHHKAWWRCEHGHEWNAEIQSRARGVGCPVCAHKLIVPGVNDLATEFPELAAQWNMEKNALLTPQNVSAYSNKKVWWRCEKGHEYQAVVAPRAQGRTGCPYCGGKKVLVGFNDLATVEPKLATQWHVELNGELTPQMVTRGSNKKVWWQCSFGHVWKAVIFSRTGKRSTGCPVCAGKVKERIPSGETPRFE